MYAGQRSTDDLGVPVGFAGMPGSMSIAQLTMPCSRQRLCQALMVLLVTSTT